MEDILEIYQKPYDPLHPVVCMDGSMKQHTKEVVRPRFVSSGKPYCYDYEYDEKRNGVSHLFMYYEPFKGYRRVYVEKAHTKREWVLTMKSLMEECYSQARKVTVVMDNLATHQPSAFYEFLCPEEARDLLNRMEFHYTPKHASGLNIAEIELSVLSRECLDRRIPEQQTLIEEISSWEKKRNRKGACTNWRFQSKDARVKLKKLYPSI